MHKYRDFGLMINSAEQRGLREHYSNLISESFQSRFCKIIYYAKEVTQHTSKLRKDSLSSFKADKLILNVNTNRTWIGLIKNTIYNI